MSFASIRHQVLRRAAVQGAFKGEKVMPIFGLGIHVLIALFFAVHAIRSGQQMYWLIILFSFPLLGSIVYFLVIYLPDSRLDRGIRKATVVAKNVLDPGRELREAEQAFDLTPTAQNQLRLANALLEAGFVTHAQQEFEGCLKGPFAEDPDIRFGAARAMLQNQQGARAADLLATVRTKNPDYRPEQVSLLLAQAFAATGRHEETRREFVSAIERFGSFEARAEYALWALQTGDVETALGLQREIEKSMKHWNKHTRSLNKPLTKRLDAAYGAIRGQTP
jgi:hypothetical protein